MTVYGVTGARKINEKHEKEIVLIFLELLTMDRLVHGCCTGVDELCTFLVIGEGPSITAIVPPNRRLVSQRAYKNSDEIVLIPDGPDGYKRRNQEVVDRSDVLLAFPMYPENHPLSRRSGTWQTVRLARRKGIPVYEYILSEFG